MMMVIIIIYSLLSKENRYVVDEARGQTNFYTLDIAFLERILNKITHKKKCWYRKQSADNCDDAPTGSMIMAVAKHCYFSGMEVCLLFS